MFVILVYVCNIIYIKSTGVLVIRRHTQFQMPSSRGYRYQTRE